MAPSVCVGLGTSGGINPVSALAAHSEADWYPAQHAATGRAAVVGGHLAIVLYGDQGASRCRLKARLAHCYFRSDYTTGNCVCSHTPTEPPDVDGSFASYFIAHFRANHCAGGSHRLPSTIFFARRHSHNDVGERRYHKRQRVIDQMARIPTPRAVAGASCRRAGDHHANGTCAIQRSEVPTRRFPRSITLLRQPARR